MDAIVVLNEYDVPLTTAEVVNDGSPPHGQDQQEALSNSPTTCLHWSILTILPIHTIISSVFISWSRPLQFDGKDGFYFLFVFVFLFPIAVACVALAVTIGSLTLGNRSKLTRVYQLAGCVPCAFTTVVSLIVVVAYLVRDHQFKKKYNSDVPQTLMTAEDYLDDYLLMKHSIMDSETLLAGRLRGPCQQYSSH